MPSRLRPLLALLIATLVPLGLVACGGGDDSGGGAKASASTDVNQLLKDTFSNDAKIDSGQFALTLGIDAKGQAAKELQGPIAVKIGGPFQSQGGKLPKFKLAFGFEGAGQTINAGLTSTGDKGFVNFQGTDYAVTDQIFKQFAAGYEQAQKQAKSGQQKNQQTLASLGIDPQRWLTNPKNAGDAKVGGDDTIKITGGVDVDKLLDDVNTVLGKAGQLGLQGQAQVPSKITPAQKQQVAKALKGVAVEIYTGKDDKILRRMAVALNVQDPENPASGSAAVKLDLSLTDLNQDQQIDAPANAKPFDELAGKLGGLGLGGLGGGSAGGGANGSGGSGASNEALQKYADCVNKAGSDAAKARKCADLLNP